MTNMPQTEFFSSIGYLDLNKKQGDDRIADEDTKPIMSLFLLASAKKILACVVPRVFGA